MSSIGTGYDLSAGTFSPDGRLFQVEYAGKAVEGSGTVVGLRGRDGVVLAVEKIIANTLVEEDSAPRIHAATPEIGMAFAGLYPDGVSLVRWSTEQANEYYDQHRLPISVTELVKPLAYYVHQYTLTILRPFGCAMMVAGWDKSAGSQLWMVDPAGTSYQYTGWALGKHRQSAKTEIEKLPVKDGYVDLPIKELAAKAAAIIYQVRDESKDKHWVLELSWVGAHTDGKHQRLPKAAYDAAVQAAKDQLDSDSDEDES